MLLELLVVAVSTLVNGFFAMSELALVSARRARLQAMAREGVGGASRALALAQNPALFLSAVQVGITLVGLLAGAFGGTTLGKCLAAALRELGLGFEAAEFLAVGTVVLAIGCASLAVGELVPKQLALARPERIAVLALVGWGGKTAEPVSEREIGALVADAASAGVVEPEEKRMIDRVLRLGDLPVRAVMTPRREIDWLDLGRPVEEQLARLAASPHSRLPVGRGRVDEATGVVRAKGVMAELAAGRPVDLARLARAPLALHEGADVLAALAALRTTDLDMLLVVDEYGTCEGLVTSSDILGAIAGELPVPGAPPRPDAVRREDGSWLLDGAKGNDAAAELLGLELPAERDYHSVAGFVLDRLRRLPTAGDAFEALGWRFEVVDMDGRRIDKVLASPLRSPEEPGAQIRG